MRPPLRHHRRLLAIALAVLAFYAVAACGAGQPSAPVPTPRPVTAEEAQLLAIARFRNYDAGSRSVTARVPLRQQQVRLEGRVDYSSETGYATATGAGFAPQLLRWSPETVAIRPAPAQQAAAPSPPMPTTGWQTRAMDPSRSDLDTVLLVISRLGSDRPENPLLLQQGGALWLGEQDVDGQHLVIFASPPTDKPQASPGSTDPEASGLRLWLDSTGLIRRAQVRTSSGWVDVDFGDGHGVRLPELTAPTAAPS